MLFDDSCNYLASLLLLLLLGGFRVSVIYSPGRFLKDIGLILQGPDTSTLKRKKKKKCLRSTLSSMDSPIFSLKIIINSPYFLAEPH